MKLCEQILLYVSNELAPQQQEQMAEHVRTCLHCQQQMALLRAVETAAVPPAAPASVVEALLAKTTRKKSFFARWKTVLVTACTVLVVAVMGLAELHNKEAAQQDEAMYAYVSENLDEEYTSFAEDLEEFEAYF